VKKRWKCDGCDEESAEADILRAPSPFDPADELSGCPHCKAIDQWVLMCDVPGCKREASCGWPSGDGYRNTCGQHMRELEPKP
jgi:hypothetical protein